LRISIKIQRGYEEKFNVLSKEKKEELKKKLSDQITKELG